MKPLEIVTNPHECCCGIEIDPDNYPWMQLLNNKIFHAYEAGTLSSMRTLVAEAEKRRPVYTQHSNYVMIELDWWTELRAAVEKNDG